MNGSQVRMMMSVRMPGVDIFDRVELFLVSIPVSLRVPGGSSFDEVDGDDGERSRDEEECQTAGHAGNRRRRNHDTARRGKFGRGHVGHDFRRGAREK